MTKVSKYKHNNLFTLGYIRFAGALQGHDESDSGRIGYHSVCIGGLESRFLGRKGGNQGRITPGPHESKG
jgi:hypothetical protein